MLVKLAAHIRNDLELVAVVCVAEFMVRLLAHEGLGSGDVVVVGGESCLCGAIEGVVRDGFLHVYVGSSQ